MAADSFGHSTVPCGPANDGENLNTYDAYGGLGQYVCPHEDDILGQGAGGWTWIEVLWG